MSDQSQAKKTVIIAQVFISLMMAFSMTFIFTAIPMQFAPGWLHHWLLRFVTAWPVAFLLSMVVGPVAFFLSQRVTDLVTRS